MRTMIGAWCVLLVLLGPAQAQDWKACATQAEREKHVKQVNQSLDWFLAIVEEVPEGLAKQFRAIRSKSARPLWPISWPGRAMASGSMTTSRVTGRGGGKKKTPPGGLSSGLDTGGAK
jgi:hypothetical protein